MKAVRDYIETTIGLHVSIEPMTKQEKQKLPLYLLEGYTWYKAEIAQRACAFAEPENADEISIAATAQQLEKASSTLNMPIVIVFQTIEAYKRKRLIEKRVAFVVPEKQLYIPEFFIDLKEIQNQTPVKHRQLISMAQVIVLCHLLRQNENKKVEGKTFKELAVKFNTNAMAITRAVDNLQGLDLVETHGDKEKNIRFKHPEKELWEKAIQQNLLVNPILKTVFVDEKPKDVFLLLTNASALSEYTDMNPSKQQHYAIEKTIFYGLQKSNALVNLNEYEGKYVLEVWKYNPLTIMDVTPNKKTVDPLSLYLSLKDSQDERIEMALEQIIKKFIW